MRNTSTGVLELYEIGANQFTGFHALAQVGPQWHIDGIAADSSTLFHSQLIQSAAAASQHGFLIA